jgi:signal peptidase I
MDNEERIQTIILTLVICGFVIFGAYYVSESITSDYSGVNIVGDSMEPTIDKGNTVVVRDVDSIDAVDVGDVVTFQTSCPLDDSDYVTHRVIDRTDYGLVTQGDNTSVIDQGDMEEYYNPDGGEIRNCHPYVTDENIKGIVVSNFTENPVTTIISVISEPVLTLI